MSIYRGAGGSGDAVNDASSEATLVQTLVNNATTQAANAATSATAAQAASTQAVISQGLAADSATAAATAETNAETAETNAETAETNAASSASAASSSASTATTQAGIATTQATNASSSASAASTSATNASNSASAASTSATNASNSASAAATSATNAAASYDAFDDRYLGSKSSNPTVDNDGNTLLAGALYYNTVAPEMRVYNGSSWTFIGSGASAGVESFNTRTGAVTLTSSDVTTALTYTPLAPAAIGTTVQAYDADLTTLGAGGSSARSFLGLAIGTDVQAYDAQLADIAGLTPTDNSFIVGNGTNFVAEGASTARTSLGLGTAATTAATDYATAAQGTKADNALTAANPSYTGTLTGGTGVVNLGSGQVYKDADGNVGIGTSSPLNPIQTYKVGDYSSSSNNIRNLAYFQADTTVANSSIVFNTNPTSGQNLRGFQFPYQSSVFHISRFHTDKTTGVVNDFTIDSSGNVGIGTSSPNEAMTINRASATSAAITFRGNGVTSTSEMYVGQGSENTGYVYNRAASKPLVFGTNDTERMRIDGSGNVGIGTSSPQCDLDLGQTDSAWVRGFGMYLEDHDGSLGKQFRVYNYGETFGVSRHTASTGLGGYEGDVLKIAADGTFAFNSGYGSAATAYGCRAWVNFNGTANSNLSGTYSQLLTTVTVTMTAHGFVTGNKAYLDFTSGTAVDGEYTVTVTDANTFTVTQASRTTSGNVTSLRSTIRASGNVSSVSDNGTGNYTVNFTNAMPDANHVCNVTTGDVDAGISNRATSASEQTASSVNIRISIATTAGAIDMDYCGVAIFR